MPTLKQLTCCIRWSGAGAVLPEYNTRYGDGRVETFLAIPEIPTPFCVHLTSKGYVAPGLAMFVYMDGEYQCNRNRHNLQIPDGTHSRKYTEVNFQVRQKEVMLTDGSMWGNPWRFEKLCRDDVQYPRQSAPYKGEYIGTIEVVVLRCNPVLLNTPLPEEEEKVSTQTVYSSKAKLHIKKGQAPKTPGQHTKIGDWPRVPSRKVSEAQVDGVDEMDHDQVTRPLYGYDGQWDEPDTEDRHKANHWGFEMTGFNTGVYKPTEKGASTQAQQGKRRNANKGPKRKLSREHRSEAEDFSNEAHGSANHTTQATPPSVVINITQASPQVKGQQRQASNSVTRSEDRRDSRHTAHHSVEVEDEVSSSAPFGRERRGVSDAKTWDSVVYGQHGSPASQNSSQRCERQSWQDVHSEEKDSNSTSNWIDSINEELKNHRHSGDLSRMRSAEVVPRTVQAELNEKALWNEGKSRSSVETESEKLPQNDDDHLQSSSYRSNTADRWKRARGWTKSSQPSNSEGEWATLQARPHDIQHSTKYRNDGVSWQQPRDEITSEGLDSVENVMADTQNLGQPDVSEPPRWLPGAWPRTSPLSRTNYPQIHGLSKMCNEGHYIPSGAAQQTKDVPISSTIDPATWVPAPVQHHWGSSRVTSQQEPVAINPDPVKAPPTTERVCSTPNMNTSRFHTGQYHSGSKEITPSLRLSGAERPVFDFRAGQSSLYAIPEEVVWRKNVSHQVQSGQPAAYSHKKVTPKYMDSHENPYAVFVFQYRSQYVIEQFLDVRTEEPEEQEKERLKDLTKAEIIEHYVREKSSRTRSRATSFGGHGFVQGTAPRNVTMGPNVESQADSGIDMSSVSDKLNRPQMRNTTESIRAYTIAEEWGDAQEHNLNEKGNLPAGKERSRGDWAAEDKKIWGWNTGDQDQGNVADTSWPVQERKVGRRKIASNVGTLGTGAGYSDENWTGEPNESNARANVAWGAGKEQDQRRSSRSRVRRSKSRATGVKTGSNWNNTSNRGSIENIDVPWGGEAEQNESGHVRSWEHQKQTLPVVGQGRERRQSQENTADNVEW